MEDYHILECNQVSTHTPMNNIRKYEKKENAICKLITGSGTGFICQTTINNKNLIYLLFILN